MFYLQERNNKKNRIHPFTKLTPIPASFKKNEGLVLQDLIDKRKKSKPKVNIGDLIGITKLKETVSKSDITNWFCRLYKITEVSFDTITTYRIDNLPERYN